VNRVAARIRALAIALIALVLLTPVLLPLVTGHRLVVIDGGSMSPTLEVGDVLLASAPTGDDLHVGRIVVVGEQGGLYTHRVVEVGSDAAGGVRARLQGDANPVADPGRVEQSDVYGVYAGHVTGAAAVLVRALTTPPGTIVLLAVAVVLLLTGARGAAPRRARRSPRSPQPLDPRAADAP